MSACPVVLGVWFSCDDQVPRYPFEREHPVGVGRRSRKIAEIMSGLSLWRPRGESYVRGAVDYVVCGEERKVAFGPRPDAATAHAAFAGKFAAHVEMVEGYRVVNEHCFSFCYPEPPAIWTDG